MTLEQLQARWVDRIKRHALSLACASPSAEAWTLTAYLWAEEGAEGAAVNDALGAAPPGWLERLLESQRAEEARHAALLRERLGELGRRPAEPSVAAGLLARAKLRRLERLCARAAPRFEAGALVPLLVCVARLEATGVRVFERHVDVLAARGRADDATARVLRALLADERRHARSCAAAVERLVAAQERPALAALQREVARVDRSLGVTSSLAVWAVTAALRLRDGLRPRAVAA